MAKKFFLLLIIGMLPILGCASIHLGYQVTTGSGNLTSETRSVSGFTGIALDGSGDVQVTFGPNETLTIEAEDNILPLIETVVENHVLVIRTKPNTTITTTKTIRVSVTMKSLDSVTVAGSGNITAPGVSGDSMKVSLPGSGTITLDGTVNRVDIALHGSGNVYCDGLKAKNATVMVSGSGNVTVDASESLDATITGSGDIRYSGNPAKVTKNVKGSGDIHE